MTWWPKATIKLSLENINILKNFVYGYTTIEFLYYCYYYDYCITAIFNLISLVISTVLSCYGFGLPHICFYFTYIQIHSFDFMNKTWGHYYHLRLVKSNFSESEL